jgi:hypothetical protein
MTTPEIAPGVRVVITAGMAVGVRGVVIAKWGRLFGKSGVEQWIVDSTDLVRRRVLRADHLRVEEKA